MEKLHRICLKIIALLGILIFGYLTVASWTSSARIYTTSEAVAWSEDRVWKNLLSVTGVLLVGAGVGALADRMSQRALRVTAAAISLAVAAGCCILAGAAHSYPTADQIYVYEVAENFFTGDYTNIRTEWYFNVYPYQLGVGLVYGVLMRLFRSDSYLVIQYVQAVCAGGTVYASFEVARELFQCKKAAAMALLCTVCFVPVYLYTLYIYGETFGVCFAMLGMLFWLLANNGKQSKKGITVLYWLLSALSLSLCYIMRSALAIVLIAMVITALLKAFGDKGADKKKRWGYPALTVLLLLLATGGQKLAVAYVEKQADVELADGGPAILVVAMAIQDEEEGEEGMGPGSYNSYNLWLYFESGFDGKTASAEALRNMKQTLYRWSRDPAYMISYMNRKVLNQWNEATYGGFFMTALQEEPKDWVRDFYTGVSGDRWYGFLNLYQGTFYAMLLIYFVMLFRGKGSVFWFLPALLLIGEFFFSMLWEAKSRYVYPYIVLAMPCVAWSLVCSLTHSGNMIRNIIKRR